jgi:phospholipase C
VLPSFAWNHGDIQNEIANTWVGFVGPGIRHDRIDDRTWTDHANVRPTILSLLGLKDDYATDGRVLVEALDTHATPHALVAHRETVERLGAAYEQINAPFGQFSMDTLKASTIALKSPDSLTYNQVEAKISSLASDRDKLASQMKAALSAAAFGGQPLDERQAKGWIDQANGLLDQTDALANMYSADTDPNALNQVKHIVVIYEENHSFDNLYGGWEGVNGIGSPGYNAAAAQVAQNGTPLSCLLQLDVNLKVPPLVSTCTATDKNGVTSPSAFPNAPFKIDSYIKATDTTCPPPSVFAANGVLNGHGLAGGCTRDIVHRYYQEQFQLDGGKQDQYVLGSDAGGLTMGYYDTKQLPIYKYLHSSGHPDYAIEDNFFQGAFGGSFLNHQELIAATAPPYNGAVPTSQRSVLDSRGFPNAGYPYYTPTTTTPPVMDGSVTATCASLPMTVWMLGCGDFAVNTIQPSSWPYSSAGAAKLPLLTNETIGDELTAAGVDWAWYSGGWSNANGLVGQPGYTNGTGATCTDPNASTSNSTAPKCPDFLFQYHHQPFNYYANYAPGTPGRAHLQDEAAFISAATGSTGGDCNLKPVSFVKPIGEENEHPGYASEPNGSDHLVALLQDIENSACANDTMVIVAYDEFGGQWDHVPPPGQGNNSGPHDVWGPGTRIASLVVAPHLNRSFVVDSAEHDTTSILATIEHRFGLSPLTSRDAEVNDLSTVFTAGGHGNGNGQGDDNNDQGGNSNN